MAMLNTILLQAAIGRWILIFLFLIVPMLLVLVGLVFAVILFFSNTGSPKITGSRAFKKFLVVVTIAIVVFLLMIYYFVNNMTFM